MVEAKLGRPPGIPHKAGRSYVHYDRPAPRYIGPTYIGKPIGPQPDMSGPNWIGKRVMYHRGVLRPMVTTAGRGWMN